jgi:hypothetical protein
VEEGAVDQVGEHAGLPMSSRGWNAPNLGSGRDARVNVV